MMIVTLLALVSLARPALAQDEFAKHKAEFIKDLDARIAVIQEMKTCVEAATKKEEIQKCHIKMKTDKRIMSEQNKGMRTQRIEEKIKKLEEKKQKLEENKSEEKK